MCGRYALYSDINQIKSHFPIDRVALVEATPSYNVAPTQEVLAVIRQEGLNILDKMHWGLVPFWAKDTKGGSKRGAAMGSLKYSSYGRQPDKKVVARLFN